MNGHCVDEYPCDVHPITGENESNSGTEFRVEYQGKSYTFTDYDLMSYPYKPATQGDE